MMTIEEMNAVKKKCGATYQQISFYAGIPISTVQKVLGGITKNPTLDTMKALENAFYDIEKIHITHNELHDSSDDFVLKYGSPQRNDSSFDDRMAKYGGISHLSDRVAGTAALQDDDKHLYTASERKQFPDDRRTEIIDGVLYDMAAPSMVHQSIVLEIYVQLRECISRHHAKCIAYAAPCDVYPDRSENSVLQPDVFIICDRSQITKDDVQGPPVFVVEVLSPSTRAKDKSDKLMKYMHSGVKEYWMVDPDKKKVIVYDFRSYDKDGDYDVALYGFNDQIPVLISDGKCEIDMKAIQDILDEIY